MCHWYHWTYQDCNHVQAAAAIFLCNLVTNNTLDPGIPNHCEDILDKPLQARDSRNSTERRFREKCLACTIADIQARIDDLELVITKPTPDHHGLPQTSSELLYERKLLKMTKDAGELAKLRKRDDKEMIRKVVTKWRVDRARRYPRLALTNNMALDHFLDQDPLYL